MSEVRESLVPRLLLDAEQLYIERHQIYGDNYLEFGSVMVGMFPKGIKLTTAEDFNRFGLLVQIISKLKRYAENFTSGGHPDSSADLVVYGAMLQEVDALSKHMSAKS